MRVTEEMIREIILEVLRDMESGGRSVNAEGEGSTPLEFKLIGPAKQGIDKNEVVVAMPPAFGTAMTKTIIGIPHRQVLREIMAGIEEEGLKARLIKVHRTADVAFMSHEAAKLSGSGIGIGVQSRGTSVIHQRDLKPLQNLELFPSPLSWIWQPFAPWEAMPPSMQREKTRGRYRFETIPWQGPATRGWQHCSTTRRFNT